MSKQCAHWQWNLLEVLYHLSILKFVFPSLALSKEVITAQQNLWVFLWPVSLPDSQNTGPVRGSLLSICCLRSVLSWTLILSPEELRRWWPGITTLRLLDWEREGEEVKSLETGGRTGLSPWELSVEVVSYSVKQHTTRRLITQARAVQFLAGVGVQWISLRDRKMQLYDS